MLVADELACSDGWNVQPGLLGSLVTDPSHQSQETRR
jgi:hypothetical protein